MTGLLLKNILHDRVRLIFLPTLIEENIFMLKKEHQVGLLTPKSFISLFVIYGGISVEGFLFVYRK